MDEFGRLSGHFGYLLHRTDLTLLSRVADGLSEFGLTPARATALVYISLNPGSDQMALGRVLGINRASTMKTVNALVALDLVDRRAGRDRRSNALHLTDKGEETRLRVEDLTQSIDDANFAVLDEEERIALRRILTKLRAAAGDEARGEPPLRRLRVV